MSDYLDDLEVRTPEQRNAAQMAALAQQVAHAQAQTSAFAEILSGVDASAITSREALAQLPVTRKSALLERQQQRRAQDPFGGFAAMVRGRAMPRIYASPGPIYEPEGAASDYWRTARAMYAAGFRAGDLAHNAFSYHMTPGAFILEAGAIALGCTVFPAGTGQTEQQLEAIADLRPNAYVGTPGFLRILVEKAQAAGADISSITKAMVGGEAFPPSLQQWLAQCGIDAYQSYATADLGLIAYETAAREGLVVDEGVLVEIVRPGTGDPVPEGEVGEVVVTTFNPDYPLIRFGTGDLSAVLAGPCPTGRTNQRIKGWLGRADQTTKVRGMFVHPGQIAQVVKAHPAIQKARLVVSGEMANDQMALHIEAAEIDDTALAAIAHTVREVTKLRADVLLAAVGSLPNDGKVIEDARKYD
jgi:phenylacetate-CoA ligase